MEIGLSEAEPFELSQEQGCTVHLRFVQTQERLLPGNCWCLLHHHFRSDLQRRHGSFGHSELVSLETLVGGNWLLDVLECRAL